MAVLISAYTKQDIMLYISIQANLDSDVFYILWITFKGDLEQKVHIICMRKMYEICGTHNVLNWYSQGGAFKINIVQNVFFMKYSTSCSNYTSTNSSNVIKMKYAKNYLPRKGSSIIT